MSLLDRDRMLAIDLGASKIVLAEFRVARGDAPILLRYGIRHLDGGESSGGENARLAYIATAIRGIMRDEGIRPAPMLMTISGQAVFPRFVKLPPVGREKLSQIIQYEAEQNVPFPMDEVVWDYQLIDTDSDDLNVMLVAAKIENVTRLTDSVQAADLEPEIVDVAPMALYNAVRHNRPDLQGCAMILDIGARSSNLIFMEQNRIFSRSIPVAGNAINQELMKEFDIPFADAETMKRELGFVAFGGVYAGPDNETAERASKIIRSVLTRLHAEVNRSINFYRSQQGGSAPETVLLTGGSAGIPHMDTFFQDKLKVSVEYVNPFTRVAVAPGINTEALNADLYGMGEVVGLALRRCGPCPVEINLMPPDLVARKIFRRRKPYFALSVAGIAVIMFCWWIYFFRMSGAFETRLDAVNREVAGFTRTRAMLAQTIQKRESEAARLRELTERVAGRTRWIELLASVRDCMQTGMWITAVTPDVSGREIPRLEITVQAFSDRLQDTQQGTATERFRNRLRETPHFKDSSEIVSEMAVDTYLRRFTIRLELETPIALR